MLSVHNFESTYILFKFLPQPLFISTDYEFLPGSKWLNCKKTELDIVDFSCNAEFGQFKLNISELNYYAININKICLT